MKTKVLKEMRVIKCRLHELVVAIAGSNLEGGYSPDIARAGYSRNIQSKRGTPQKENKKGGTQEIFAVMKVLKHTTLMCDAAADHQAHVEYMQ